MAPLPHLARIDVGLIDVVGVGSSEAEGRLVAPSANEVYEAYQVCSHDPLSVPEALSLLNL
ncbi:hypothetical protein TPA0908_47670 [Micromonospora sp. AKA38]|nr:hypothetical protein TPA0908_47670 [Micromonospora sp. AKA38]